MLVKPANKKCVLCGSPWCAIRLGGSRPRFLCFYHWKSEYLASYDFNGERGDNQNEPTTSSLQHHSRDERKV